MLFIATDAEPFDAQWYQFVEEDAQPPPDAVVGVRPAPNWLHVPGAVSAWCACATMRAGHRAWRKLGPEKQTPLPLETPDGNRQVERETGLRQPLQQGDLSADTTAR